MENQEQENKVDNSDEKCSQNSKKMLNIIYLIIFLCIAIWIAFYINQNKSSLIKITNKENNTLEEMSIGSWETDSVVIENSVNNSTWIDSTTEIWTSINTNSNISWSINSTWAIKTEEDKKNEEAIIKDFEKELDSLFDVIDQNAK